MNVLYVIAWATFLLSFGFCTAAVLLGATRCRSWRIHRTVWFSVLSIGILAFLPSPLGKTVEIPVLPMVLPVVEPVFVQETVSEPVDVFVSETAPPKNHVSVISNVAQRSEKSHLSEEALTEFSHEGEISRSARNDDRSFSGIDFADPGSAAKRGFAIVVFIWLGGMLWLPIRMLFRTIRFQRHLRETEPACEEWFEAWQSLQSERSVRQTVPMLTAEDPAIGPALVWRPSGFALVVPLEGWDRLSETERESVMRHELEHFLRNDIPKSLFARILALPHWFNPLAWQTVHRFEDAAEWACDEAALRGKAENLSDFARALVSLHETALLRPTTNDGALQHNIFGRNISRRVARLLSFGAQQKKESAMKKIFLIVAGLLLLATSLVQVKLVAKNAEAETPTEVQNNEPGTASPELPREETPVPPEADAPGSFAEDDLTGLDNLTKEILSQHKDSNRAQSEATLRNLYYTKRAELEKYTADLEPGQEKEPEHAKKIDELKRVRNVVHKTWGKVHERYMSKIAESNPKGEMRKAVPGPGTQSPARETYRRAYENSWVEVEAVTKAWRDGTTTFDQLVDAQTRLLCNETILRAYDPEAKIEPAKPLPIAEALERYKNRNEALADPAYRELIVRWMNAAEEMLRRQFKTVAEKNPSPVDGDYQKDVCFFYDEVYEFYEIIGDRSAMQTVLKNQAGMLHQLRQKAISVERPYFMQLLETRNAMASILKTNTSRLTRIVPEGTEQVLTTLDHPLDFWHKRMTLKHKDYLETEIKYLNGAQGGRAVDREKARLGWLEARVEYDFFNADLADLRIAALLREESAKNFRQAAKASFNAGVVDESVVKEAEMEVAAAVFAPNNLPVADIAALEKSVTLADGKPAVLCLKIVRTSGPPTGRRAMSRSANVSTTPNEPETVSPSPGIDDLVWKTLGIRYTPVPKERWKEVAGKDFEKHPNGGVTVDEVRQGSIFAKNEIKAGDILIGIRDWTTTSQNDLQYIAQWWQNEGQNSGGEKVQVLLFRDGQKYFKDIFVAENNSGTQSPARGVDPDYVKLLEKRVELSKQYLAQTTAMYKSGAAGGRAHMFHEAQIRHAGNQTTLYKYLGDRKKYLVALKEKTEATRMKYQSLGASYRVGTATLDQVTDAELAVAEAEYELKQAEKNETRNNEPGTTSPPYFGNTPGAQIPARDMKELTFQGKTFEQWVEELKTELDPKLRAEAFRALAMFGANGRGREATAVIVNAVAGINFDSFSQDAPMENMKFAAKTAFTDNVIRIPFEDSMPTLMKNFTEGNAHARSFAKNVFSALKHGDGTEELIPLFYGELMQWKIDDRKDDRPLFLLRRLAVLDPDGESMLRYVQDALEKNDAERFRLPFVDLTPARFNGPYLLIGENNDWSTPLGLFPCVVDSTAKLVGGTKKLENPRLRPFGQSLLELLREKGVTSKNETIRETSAKVAEALEAAKNVPAKPEPVR